MEMMELWIPIKEVHMNIASEGNKMDFVLLLIDSLALVDFGF